jgi:hypothetical protein
MIISMEEFGRYFTDSKSSATRLFDEETVLDISYTKEGTLLYINENNHPGRLDQARTAWRAFFEGSFPLADLLAMIRNSELPVPDRA